MRAAVDAVLAALDSGELRVASKDGDHWITHAWVKEAVLLYFAQSENQEIAHGPFRYRDKIPLKQDPTGAQIRVVPPATIRYGAHLEPGVICMPSYVNVGAYVATGTMVDTWATVGSCAQIGRNVHLSGGVGIGGRNRVITPGANR